MNQSQLNRKLAWLLRVATEMLLKWPMAAPELLNKVSAPTWLKLRAENDRPRRPTLSSPALKSITTCLAAIVGFAHAAEAVAIAAEGTGMAKA